MARRALWAPLAAAAAILLSGCASPGVNHPPEIRSSYPPGDPAVPEGGSAEFRIEASDPDGGLLSCRWFVDGVLSASAPPPFAFTYSPGRTPGEHTVLAIVSDGSLTAQREWRVTVYRVNHPPSFASRDPPSLSLSMEEGYSVEFRVSVVDEDGDPVLLSWFIDGGPAVQGRSSIRFEPNYSMAGEHIVRAVASDGVSEAELAWSVLVADVNRAPRVLSRTPASDPRIRELESVDFAVEALDDDGDALSLTWYLDGLPVGAGSGWTYTTDHFSSGNHTVLVNVSDGRLETDVDWRVRVENLNRPPELTAREPEGEVTTGEYEPITLSINGRDEDGDPLSVRWFVDNASEPSATGWSFRYVPGYESAGRHEVRAELSDGADNASTSWSVIVVRPTARWTVLAYMCADNDLEPYLLEDVSEMERVGSSGEVSIVVQLDRHPSYDASGGDWSETRRYRVERGGGEGQPGSRLLQSLGELNMGSEEVLRDFILWGLEHFPAERYMLVIGGHGDGWQGISQDFSNANSRISPAGLASALGALEEARGGALEVLQLDVCYWAMLETGWPLRSLVQFIVGSEDIDPSAGQSYDALLASLSEDPGMGARELAREAVRVFATAYTDGMYWPEDNETFTYSAVNASGLEGVASAIDAFAGELLANLTTWRSAVAEARLRMETYGRSDYIDLRHIVTEVRARSTGNRLNATADALAAAIDGAVELSLCGAQRPNSRGVSIYFPQNPSSYKLAYDALGISASHIWDDFLRAYHGVGGRAEGNGGARESWAGEFSEFQSSSAHHRPSPPRACAESPPTSASSPPSCAPPPFSSSPPPASPPRRSGPQESLPPLHEPWMAPGPPQPSPLPPCASSPLWLWPPRPSGPPPASSPEET
ncbi:MAG: clostripain-related cysteine peptidase [Thermoplasmatota archaeon]